MRKLTVEGNNETQRIYIRGDKHKETEPREFYIHFPGGTIGVTRCSDGSYWAHIDVMDYNEDFSDRVAKAIVVDVRIDRHKKPPESIKDDLANCYHIAVKLALK